MPHCCQCFLAGSTKHVRRHDPPCPCQQLVTHVSVPATGARRCQGHVIPLHCPAAVCHGSVPRSSVLICALPTCAASYISRPCQCRSACFCRCSLPFSVVATFYPLPILCNSRPPGRRCAAVHVTYVSFGTSACLHKAVYGGDGLRWCRLRLLPTLVRHPRSSPLFLLSWLYPQPSAAAAAI